MSNYANKFNEQLKTNYFVNDKNEVIINGICNSLVLSEEEQTELLRDIDSIIVRNSLGDEPTMIERLFMSLVFEGKYCG